MSLGTPTLTPLSPSSVGSTGPGASTSDMISYRPRSDSAGVTAAGAPAAHHRMLTSTAAERKRTVAACRALRAQISRFEDAFFQLHGRPPKGAADRAPLATTYAQYREWKRAIRADAACRIQALFRGYISRCKLLGMGNAALNRVIMKRTGRPGGSALEKLAPPDLPDVPSPSPPQWSAKQPASPPVSPSLQHVPSSPTASQPDISNMSFADLQARKRDLKQQLKQYDMNFARKHGRMPVKAEKEPIRHLYEAYNTLKSQISQLEADGRHLSLTPPVAAAAPNPVPQRTVSPPSGSEGSEDSTAGARISPNPLPRNKRKLPKPSSGSVATSTASSTVASVPMSTGTTVAAEGQDLAALKAEKSNLHTMLRSYEKDFFRENNRQVSSFADIKPVASQYRRYKEIKKAIAARQQQTGER